MKIDPKYEKKLRDGAFNAAKDKDGYYVCAKCGLKDKSRVPFQVDHIIPLNHKDGKTVPGNLQILCRSCNAKKSFFNHLKNDADCRIEPTGFQ